MSMDEDQKAGRSERSGISMRAAEITIALLVFVLGAIVVFDSYRLGSKWGSDGPQSGYFPFYVGLLICISSLVTFVQALMTKSGRGDWFVTWGPIKLVLTVLIPAA